MPEGCPTAMTHPRLKLLLTGAAGMVGRNVVDAAPANWSVSGPRRRELDLGDIEAIRRFLRREAPDIIVHAAGKVGGIAANMKDPPGFLSENIRIGLNVLETADELGINVVNLASSCIYPPDAPNPLTEEMLLTGGIEPTNEGYALAKIAVLRYGQYLNRVSGRERVKSLIPSNLYGRYDRFDLYSSHLIPAIIAKICGAIEGGGDVEIWGDGSARREFLYAGDFARMLWFAVEHFDELPDIMNIGVGEDHSVSDYYQAVADVAGWRGTFRFDLNRPVGMRRKLVDVTHQRRLGFPVAGELRSGLAETYAFYLETLSQ